MKFDFNPASTRARRARMAAIYCDKWMILAYKLIAALSFLLGVAFIFASQPVGWLVLIITAIATMFYAWSKGDLEQSDFEDMFRGESIQVDAGLEFSMLRNLRAENPSAYDLWKSLEKTEDRFFINNRFMIDDSYFEQLLDKSAGSAKAVWPIVESYRGKFQLSGYSNIAVLVALVASVPNHEQLLKSVKLDIKDIETGIPWMRDILEKRRLVRTKRSFGGIGRDFAFGYTPILRSLGYNISRDIELNGFFSDTSMHHKIVDQMIQMMTGGNGTVTLVGDTGVGKTTCVHAFAEKVLAGTDIPERIRHNQVVALDAPTLIANAKNPGQLEELMLKIFAEAHRAKNMILFFDDAEVFFGFGSSIDLTHVIQPALDASSFNIILAMSPIAWQRLAGANVAGKLKPLHVPPADEENTIAVLRDSIALTEYRNKVAFTYQALQESYKLGERYVTNLAMPGAALSILEQAGSTAQQQLITREIVQASVEQTYGIKLQASSQAESNQLLNLEQELHKYVINQDRAVTVVADALRRARSGVGNPNRPVGTFLFLGPTGVGKTELSKALARVYFGDVNSLIRLDMNQFVSPNDVIRLIQPMQGSELGFLGQVRKQPFSVILLDEIEKAHQSVINALLQMLDEGVMHDSDGRAVSFKDAIVIATSNAGASNIRTMIDEGKNIAAAESMFVESLIGSGAFAPELINRFDEVVIFKPLEQDELIQVIDIIISDINKNLDAQKVQVTLSEPAKKWLVEKGYDSKLGARPMRRMAQRYVENTIAKRLLEHSIESGGTIQLDIKDFEETSKKED